jgi:hypothetical protein
MNKTGTMPVLVRLALATGLAVAPVTAAAAQSQQGNRSQQQQAQGQTARSRGFIVPVDGLVGAEGAESTGEWTGTLAIQRFARTNTGIGAIGTLTASLDDPSTGTVRTIVTQVVVPIATGESATQTARTAAEAQASRPAVVTQQPQQDSCGALHLVLGPLDLDLLGQRVQLNESALAITAVPGNGNLLGNQLCAIAGMLDDTGQVTRLIAMMNEVLQTIG